VSDISENLHTNNFAVFHSISDQEAQLLLS